MHRNYAEDEGAVVGECVAIHETEKALHVRLYDDEMAWVPKSQIHDDSEVWSNGQKGTLIVTEWYAKQKGWP
jgi:hypothetical protein